MTANRVYIGTTPMALRRGKIAGIVSADTKARKPLSKESKHGHIRALKVGSLDSRYGLSAMLVHDVDAVRADGRKRGIDLDKVAYQHCRNI